jgi:predicted transcriptional regulator
MLFGDIVHKALANETRREILVTLSKKKKYLTEIANNIKKKPQTVNFHLNFLIETGLIGSEIKSGKRYYFLKNNEILNFLKERKPVPPGFMPKSPNEAILELWKDLIKRMDRIEGKIDKLLKKQK